MGLNLIRRQAKTLNQQVRGRNRSYSLHDISILMQRIAIIAVGTMGSACANAAPQGTWRLVSIDSKPVSQAPSGQVPYFTITGTSIEGFDGCNEFSGRIDQPGGISATRRGCPEGTIKLPLDFDNLPSHLQGGTIDKNLLSVPARGPFPASKFEHSE